MHASEADLQRSYAVWDLYDAARNQLSALLRQEDVFDLGNSVDGATWRTTVNQSKRR